MKPILVAVLLSTLLLLNCGPPISQHLKLAVKAVPLENQELTYHSGRQCLVSRKEFSNVGLCLLFDIINPYDSGRFYIEFYNKTADSMLFSIDRIKASCGEYSVRVLTFDEAVDREIDRTSRGSGSMYILGLPPSEIARQSTVDSFRPSLPSWVEMHYQKQRFDYLKDYASSLLKRETILPKGVQSGVFVLEHPVGQPILTIEVAGPRDQHRFTFNLTR
ncbi:MAG: hypothetical protein AB1512_01595 [Thermodesulfobacteriota bacterium]